MRRAVLLAALLLLSLARPLTAQAPELPPHSWLFGAWIGGLFPPPVTLTAQECLAQPMVVFTRDVVMRAIITSPAYVQRQVDMVRVTANGFEFRFLPTTPAPGEPAASMGFGCVNPDVLTVQRRGENEISFPNCSQFPFPLIRCATH